MSKIPLPPPPGFRRIKKEFGKSKRYVYPFTDSESGYKAQLLHELFLAEEEKRWKTSKLRRIAIRLGRSRIKSCQFTPQSVRNDEALKLGITLASMHHPIFVRRNPLDQVFEHMRHQPRYFMKIDIADAFRCVYPGFHESFFRPVVGSSDDLFQLAQRGEEKQWDGWPFFHSGENGLIQGAPSSPILFERACASSGLDKLLRDTANANNAVVTRYVDDIVFSRLPWDDRPFGKRVYKTLCNRIQSCGFKLSRGKSRRSVDTQNESLKFLGVAVYRNRVKVNPAFFARMAQTGFWSEGHQSWIDQIEDLQQLLWMVRNNKRAGD